MDDRFDQSLWMTVLDCLNYVGAGGGESHARARLCEIDYRQSNKECRSRDDLEIDERLRAHSSHFSQSSCTCNPDHDGREHQRRDDGFYQVNENVAQKINGISP